MLGTICFPGVIQRCSPSSFPKFCRVPFFGLDFGVTVIMFYVCSAPGEAILQCFPSVPLCVISSFTPLRMDPAHALKRCSASLLPVILGGVLTAPGIYVILLPAMVTVLLCGCLKRNQKNHIVGKGKVKSPWPLFIQCSFTTETICQGQCV